MRQAWFIWKRRSCAAPGGDKKITTVLIMPNAVDLRIYDKVDDMRNSPAPCNPAATPPCQPQEHDYAAYQPTPIRCLGHVNFLHNAAFAAQPGTPASGARDG